ncbi:MAG: hypothetical protein NC548_53455 [Lachnospiraceae bacterium]|nr:hypothetical protein [Lachnospiraceae bacterium]
MKEIDLEDLQKEVNKALAVAVVLENELGMQSEAETACVVCVIKEYLIRIRDMVQKIDNENGQSEEEEV